MTRSPNPALVVSKNGGHDCLEIRDWDYTDPGPDQVQVRVLVSGVNFMDVYQREGIYPNNPPFVLGGEGAGEVIAVGSGVSTIAVGDVIVWATQGGSHSTFLNVNAAAAIPVPAGLDPELATASILQGMTAHYLVNSTYSVQPGDSVLIHAAAGGTGQQLVQLCSARGARVIATVGSAEKQAKALELGADTVLRYDQVDDLAPAVRAANGGAGVSVVYDGVGKSTFDASLASLEPRGLLVLFGASSGQVPPFELQRLNFAGSLFVTRPSMTHYLRTRDELLWRAGDVLNSVADGSLKIEIGARFPLADGVAAYEALENRTTSGKVLLTR